MLARSTFVLAFALATAGCVTTQPHGLSAADVGQLKLTSIEARLAPGTAPLWPKIVTEYRERKTAEAAARGLPEEPEKPGEAIGYANEQLNLRVRSVMEAPLRERLNGRRGVKMVMIVHDLDIPSAAARFLRSLASRGTIVENRLVASVALIDEKTGAVVLEYPKTKAVGFFNDHALIKIGEPADSMSDLISIYNTSFLAWLVKSSV